MNDLTDAFKFITTIPSWPRKISTEFNKRVSAIGSAINARFQHVASWCHNQAYRDRHIAIAKQRRTEERILKESNRKEQAKQRAEDVAANKKRLEEEKMARSHQYQQKQIAKKISKELSSYTKSAAYFFDRPNMAKPAAKGSELSKLYNGVSVKFYTFDRSDLTDKDFKMLAGIEATTSMPEKEMLWHATPYLEGISRNLIGLSLQSINQGINEVVSKWDPLVRSELVVWRHEKQIYANQSKWVTELLLVHISDVERPALKRGAPQPR